MVGDEAVAKNREADRENGGFREQGLHLAPRDEVNFFVFPKITRRKGCDLFLDRNGEKLIKRKHRVRFDRKEFVGSRNEVAEARDAANFVCETLLLWPWADVFDDRVGKDPVERTRVERQISAVCYIGFKRDAGRGANRLRRQINDRYFVKMLVEIQKFAVDAGAAANVE